MHANTTAAHTFVVDGAEQEEEDGSQVSDGNEN